MNNDKTASPPGNTGPAVEKPRNDVYVRVQNILRAGLRSEQMTADVVFDWEELPDGTERLVGVEVLAARGVEVDGLDVHTGRPHGTPSPSVHTATSATPPGWGWGRLLPSAGYARCYGCKRPWWACQHRIVDYSVHVGQFALCTRCWDRATVEERVAAHRWLTEQWLDGDELWPQIEAAVRRRP